MANLDEPRLLVTTLPADPLGSTLDFDDEALAGHVLAQAFTGRTANGVGNLPYVVTTSDSLVRHARGGQVGSRWRAFVGLRRNGGVDVGVGAVLCHGYREQSDLAGVSGYRLFILVHAARVAIETQGRLIERTGTEADSPVELIVAVPGAQGAVLCGLADGWEEPEHDFDPLRCLEPDLLIRTEVETWPLAPAAREELLLKVSGRICEAFGDPAPRFLPRVASGAVGHLSPTYG